MQSIAAVMNHRPLPAAGKTMNKKIMVAVEQAFIERFGPWAGWAHNTLFISELASQRDRLPAHLQPGAKSKPGLKAPQLDPPAGIDDHAALELRSLAPSDRISTKGTTLKKRRTTGGGSKTAKDKAWEQAAAEEGNIKDEVTAAITKGLILHGSGLDRPEEKASQQGRRTKSKPRATRSSTAQPGKLERTKTSGSVDVTAAAAAAVDQVVEDGAKAAQALTKRKR